ncbi:hypothetical protein HK104_002005 [Borealophlyctis nickersoniae]|nr:hypothetical protein HK104_002005 [Borealophlyctis nickersoniae]
MEQCSKLLTSDIGCEDQMKLWESKVNLQKKAKLAETTIALIGASGAGKTSLINSLLDAPGLLYVSDCQAGTAVATSLSYNSENHLFMAKIHYQSREEFDSHCGKLLADLPREDVDEEEADHGVVTIAEHIFRALFPNMPLSKYSMEEFCKEEIVMSKLGTVETIETTAVEDFATNMHPLFDHKVRPRWEDLKADEKVKEMLSLGAGARTQPELLRIISHADGSRASVVAVDH